MDTLELEVKEESHVSVPLDEIVGATGALLGEHGSDAQTLQALWQRMCQNLAVVVAVHYDAMTTRVRAAYEAPPSRSRQLDSRLLRDMVQLFDAAQYAPLTRSQWELAEEGQFEFNFPVECRWEKIDPDFTREYYAKYCDGMYLSTGDRVPDFAQYILIYTRGVSEAERTGLFIVEKLNLLVESLWAKALGCFIKREPPKPRLTPQCTNAPGTKRVRRVTVEDICRREGILNVFLKKLVVHEPVFSNVAVVYRSAPTRKQKAVSKAVERLRRGRGTADAAVPKEMWSTDERPVKMELYDKIPFGDLDAVLPEKQINLRPFDTVKFAILVLVGIIVCIVALGKVFVVEHESGSAFLFLLFIVTAVKETLDLIKGWKMARFEYTNKVQEYQQQRMVGAGMPVVTQLVDDVKSQELKEMVLGYFFLWRHSLQQRASRAGDGRLPAQAVDTMVEDFMLRQFGIRMDFEIGDAFAKLESVGLVAQCGGGPGREPDYRIAADPDQWLSQHDEQMFTSLQLRPPAPISARRN